MDIANKVAVITGGASGLGEATVERFCGLGAKVAIFDLNDEAGSALANRLGEDVAYFNVNVADEDSVAAALEGVKARFGDIHLLQLCRGRHPGAHAGSGRRVAVGSF